MPRSARRSDRPAGAATRCLSRFLRARAWIVAGAMIVAATFAERAAAQQVPLHAFAVFYEGTLEIGTASAGVVGGPVHANSDAYFKAGASLDFPFPVTAAGAIYHGTHPYYSPASLAIQPPGFFDGTEPPAHWTDGSAPIRFGDGAGGLVAMNTGADIYLDARSPNWLAESNARWNSTLDENEDPIGMVRDEAHGMGRYGLPFPAGVDPHVLIEDSLNPYSLAGHAGLRIQRTGSSIVGRDADGELVPLTYLSGSTTVNVVATPTFYDMREKRNVSSIDVDLTKLRNAPAGPLREAYANGLLYVSNETTGGNPGVVRLINGSRLPESAGNLGFTVVTEDPLYIKGEYNTFHPDADRPPAMVAADAITILSNAWFDSNSWNTTVYSRNASATTTNAVFLAGDVPTGSKMWQGQPVPHFSGGAENLLRYLENWSGVTHTVKGTVACLWTSRIFTTAWNRPPNFPNSATDTRSVNDIYGAPKRNWMADAHLLETDGPPGGLFLSAPPIGEGYLFRSPNEENAGRFGVSVAGMNDATGDGIPDIMVGAYFEDPGAVPSDSGKAYLYSGLNLQLDLLLSSPSPATSGQFGRNVRGLGDITGDGLVDLIVSAPGETAGGFAGAGKVHLFNGATGALIRSHSSPNPEAGGQFGARGNGINDVTGDGKTDVLVSSTFEDPGASPTDAGRVYVFNSQTGALFRTYVSPAEEPNGNFGLNAIGLKDVTGDGKGDLLVGAPGEDPGAAPDGSGVVYLMNGATGAVVWSAASPSPQLAGRFGAVVSRLDDVTGDGKMDVAVGAPDESANGVNAGSGRVHLFNGATGAFLRTIPAPNPQTGGGFGQSIANIPDTNGDGWGDLVIGAPYVNNPGISAAGRAYVVSGRNGVVLRVIDSPEPEASAEFGFAVGAVPDLDGNGYAEYVIGARKADPGAAPSDAGRAYLFYGKLLP